MLVGTNTSISEEEVIHIYGKRWDNITKVQLEEFMVGFVQRLPKYMQDALERREIAV